MKKARVVIAWVLAILLAVMFMNAGVKKFDAASGWTRAFHNWGYPDWFRILIGAGEVAAALLVLVPRTAKYGALLIVSIMLGGVATNMIFSGTRHLVGPLVPLVVASVLFALRYTATPPLASASSARE